MEVLLRITVPDSHDRTPDWVRNAAAHGLRIYTTMAHREANQIRGRASEEQLAEWRQLYRAIQVEVVDKPST